MFRVLICGKVRGENLTAAQTHLLVGAILEQLVLQDRPRTHSSELGLAMTALHRTSDGMVTMISRVMSDALADYRNGFLGKCNLGWTTRKCVVSEQFSRSGRREKAGSTPAHRVGTALFRFRLTHSHEEENVDVIAAR